jgi:hypothetical protein
VIAHHVPVIAHHVPVIAHHVPVIVMRFASQAAAVVTIAPAQLATSLMVVQSAILADFDLRQWSAIHREFDQEYLNQISLST